jgi:hypothetical protein
MLTETGFPRADAENAFLQARRRQVLARIAHRLRRESGDLNLPPLEQVVSTLGWRGEVQLGLRLALAQRRGEPIPPIEVYRVGGLHFVQDGHHRVSIARATGQPTIDAYVTEVVTASPGIEPSQGGSGSC